MTIGLSYPATWGTDLRSTIQRAMQAAFPEFTPNVETFYAMQEYHLGWRDLELRRSTADPGKLLRPQLALLACCAVGGTAEMALPLAAAIQLAHDFTLLHDDIQDNSDLRRGRVTVWKQWGVAQAINAGDGMLLVAHLALAQLLDAGVQPRVALEVMRRFDRTLLEVCEGQFLDMSFEGQISIGEDDYLAMIGRKTATLIASSAALGGLVGGAEPESVAALHEFGWSLGLAFQIEDDLLGIWGDPQITGKPFAADLRQRKLSLPIIRALRQEVAADVLRPLYHQPSMDERAVLQMLAALAQTDARSACQTLAAHYHQQALDALSRVRVAADDSAQAAREHMFTITASLLGRTR